MALTHLARIKNKVSNRLINGGFDFWQRGGISAFSLMNPGGYVGPDRWQTTDIGGGAGSVQRDTIVPNNLSQYSALFVTNTPTSADNDGFIMEQRIEASMINDLVGKAISFGFYHRASADAPTEVNIVFSTADVEDDFSSVTAFETQRLTLTNDDSWTQVQVKNLVLPSNASRGISITLTFDNVGTTSVNSFTRVTQFMLGEGPGVPRFIRAGDGTYARELSLAQRYFCKSYNLDITPGTAGVGPGQFVWNRSIGFAQGYFKLPVTMRAIPTVTVYSPTTGAVNMVRNEATAADVVGGANGIGQTGVGITGSGATSQGLAAHCTVDAEL